jgi:hypothetical protein
MRDDPAMTESRHSMQLDGIDAFLMLASATAFFALVNALGFDAGNLRGGAIIAGMLAGPLARRALGSSPPPHKPTRSKVAGFFTLVLIATGVLVGGFGILLVALRLGDGKQWTGAALTAAVGLAILAVGAVVDRSQRVTRR